MTKNQKIAFLLILFLAIFFRTFQLIKYEKSPLNPTSTKTIQADMPGGLFPDEAANGLDIISMEQGQLQPFYERGNGREALFFYMIWAMVKIFGFGVWQHHLTSALIGIIACIGTFFLSRVLFNLYGDKNKSTNIALLGFFLISTSSWHTVLSRTAFRANLIPLFATFTFYFLIKSWNSETLKKKLIYSTLLGATFALGFYTYIAYRILVPILFFAVLWPLFKLFLA